MAVISWKEAKDHIRDPMDHTNNDGDIAAKLDEATAAVLAYVTTADPLWDESTAPAPVKAAVKILLLHLYERGEDMSDADAWQAIDRVLKSTGYRDPVVA